MRWMLNVAVIAALGFAPAAGADERRTLSVSATETVDVVPDLATLSLGVTTFRDEAAEAMEANSAAMSDVLATLAELGIEERDLQTSNLSLSPRWNRSRSNDQPPEIVGFIASNQLAVRVRDLDALGGVLDAVLDDGANTFQGLSFGVAEPAPHLDAARVAAVTEARRKAELLADAAGVALGPLLSMSEATLGGRPVPMARAEMAMADAVPIAAGEVGLSATVSLVFQIGE